jgi:hypothetical protein
MLGTRQTAGVGIPYSANTDGNNEPCWAVLSTSRASTSTCDQIQLTVGFDLWNYGPTPAWPEVAIVHARAHHTAQLEGQPLPDFTHSSRALLGGVLTPNEGRPYEVSYPEDQQLCVTQDEWQQVDKGDLNLFFYGVIL